MMMKIASQDQPAKVGERVLKRSGPDGIVGEDMMQKMMAMIVPTVMIDRDTVPVRNTDRMSKQTIAEKENDVGRTGMINTDGDVTTVRSQHLLPWTRDTIIIVIIGSNRQNPLEEKLDINLGVQ
jgi:hypothetical protein